MAELAHGRNVYIAISRQLPCFGQSCWARRSLISNTIFRQRLWQLIIYSVWEMVVLKFCRTNWQSLDWTTKSNGTGLLIDTDVTDSNGRMLIPTDIIIYSSFSSKSNQDLNEWLDPVPLKGTSRYYFCTITPQAPAFGALLCSFWTPCFKDVFIGASPCWGKYNLTGCPLKRASAYPTSSHHMSHWWRQQWIPFCQYIRDNQQLPVVLVNQ